MPMFIRNYTDDEATIIMVDSNIQREHILPSEKAFAYKMKLDAIKHQGKTSGQLVQKQLLGALINNTKALAALFGKTIGEEDGTES